MPKYSYICRKASGEKEAGVIEGPSQEDVVEQLQKKGLIVTSIISFDVGKRDADFAKEPSRTAKERFSHKSVKTNDLVLFARQLAMLLGAGVSLLRSLDVILKQVDSKKLFDIISAVHHDMEGGRTLRDSIAKYPDVFSSLWINLIETGEASGNLPTVLEKLAYYLEQAASFRRKIVSALIYPCILLLVSISAVIFFIIKIVPTFAQILTAFGVDLPFATKIVIALSNLLTKNFLLLVIIGVVLVVVVKYLIKRPPFNRMLEEAEFKMPILGDFLRYLLIEQFATTMSILIESGVPILYALEISERSCGSIKFAETLAYLKKTVKDGRSMAGPMEKSEFFTPMVVQMVAIGEEIGELANMLKRISKFYQDYLETFVVRLAAIFEPLMIVFMGLVIGALVISIFLPIFSLAMMKTAG